MVIDLLLTIPTKKQNVMNHGYKIMWLIKNKATSV
jgi:hypothetical protein